MFWLPAAVLTGSAEMCPLNIFSCFRFIPHLILLNLDEAGQCYQLSSTHIHSPTWPNAHCNTRSIRHWKQFPANVQFLLVCSNWICLRTIISFVKIKLSFCRTTNSSQDASRCSFSGAVCVSPLCVSYLVTPAAAEPAVSGCVRDPRSTSGTCFSCVSLIQLVLLTFCFCFLSLARFKKGLRFGFRYGASWWKMAVTVPRTTAGTTLAKQHHYTPLKLRCPGWTGHLSLNLTWDTFVLSSCLISD